MATQKLNGQGRLLDPRLGDQLLSEQSSSAARSTGSTEKNSMQVDFCAQKSAHLLAAGAHGAPQRGVISRSGRHRPCPICGRRKDHKCTWGSDFISCYPGTTHNPPEHLKVGDTIEAAGITWALIRKDRGWSGRHWIFKPHRPINPGQQPQQQHQARRPVDRRQAHKVNRLSKGLAVAIADAIDALAVSETELHLLTAPELKARFELVHDQPRSLRLMIQALREDDLDWGRQIRELEGLLVAVLHHQSMVKRFRRDCLAEDI